MTVVSVKTLKVPNVSVSSKFYYTALVVELSNFIALPLFFTCTFPHIVQWLVYSGIGGKGAITNALSGGDVKQAIYLHKLIFEARICTNVKHFNYCE